MERLRILFGKKGNFEQDSCAPRHGWVADRGFVAVEPTCELPNNGKSRSAVASQKRPAEKKR